jgi:DNA-binding NtrC family response regulator
LARHHWPGNIRELENAVGHGCMMALGETIDLQDLPEYLWASARNSARLFDLSEENAISFEDHEKRLIIDALEQAKWNQSVAARTLRIGRDALRYKMKKHGLDTPQSGNAAAS